MSGNGHKTNRTLIINNKTNFVPTMQIEQSSNVPGYSNLSFTGDIGRGGVEPARAKADAYDQQNAAGFILLNALHMRIAANKGCSIL